MAVVWCSLLMWTMAIFTFFNVDAQSTAGFISIDCGLPSNSSYKDEITGIPYTSDDGYTDTGENFNIASLYRNSYLSQAQLLNVRSFPDGARNCYNLKPLEQFSRYNIRATFLYGNYDGLNSVMPSMLFDLYIDVIFWKTVNITQTSNYYVYEAIVVAPQEYMSVCLIKTGSATPFISALELRPFKLNDTHLPVTSDQHLAVVYRENLGATEPSYLRYPDDPYDRIWWSWLGEGWTNISVAEGLMNQDNFWPPTAVMRTAAVPVNSSQMQFSWSLANTGVANNAFYIYFHFAELVPNVSRYMNIYLNEKRWLFNITMDYLSETLAYDTPGYPVTFDTGKYEWTINSTAASKYPPLLNALEVFSPLYLNQSLTNSTDVRVITEIKREYGIKRNWEGDPCGPTIYIWKGLNCSSSPRQSSRIISLNLSSNELNGSISSSFGQLTNLQYLNLFNNSLTGGIPENLGNLESLRILNLSCNNLTGQIPDVLYAKTQTGMLKLGLDDDSHPCPLKIPIVPIPPQPKKNVVVPIVGAAIGGGVVLLLLVVVFIVWRRKQSGEDPVVPVQIVSKDYIDERQNHPDPEEPLEIQQFLYSQLAHMTRNFAKSIGRGGFGIVYLGHLESGKPVAIKMRTEAPQQGSSLTSDHGTKALFAEINNLKRIHHRNLVSLIGYCIDGSWQALVYEYMAQGSLTEHLRGIAGDPRLMHWRERLRVAVESAQGLEYLHKGCNPPIIHRDIKTSNILFNDNLEAKISDFGLSRALKSDHDTHIMTGSIAGTPGYLDPEFNNNIQLTAKSDVYSFGIVLLELITGQPAINSRTENVHIVQWVIPIITRGDIDEIVDSRLGREYNASSVWKVLDLAMKCTARMSTLRPTMSDVLTQLKESLEMVNASEASKRPYSEGFLTRFETTSFEIGFNPQEQFGPSAR